jgi:hypothetical protein
MITTLASATQVSPRKVSIMVDADYAKSLYVSLKKHAVKCSPPSAAAFVTKRVYIDADGKRQVEEEAFLCEIVAVGSINDFPGWMGDWVSPEKS